jgi:hypothetical protein
VAAGTRRGRRRARRQRSPCASLRQRLCEILTPPAGNLDETWATGVRPYECDEALPLLEAIEQQATAKGIPVDSRIERGRTARHAVREPVSHERYDRMVVAAATNGDDGFRAADVAWLLDHAPGDLVILRPAPGHAERLTAGSRWTATPATTSASPASSTGVGSWARTSSPMTVAVAGRSETSSA